MTSGSNGKQIHADVLKWHVDVEEIQNKSDLSPSFKCIPCFPIPNPVSRLRLGREAVQKSKTVTELTDSATKLFVKGIAYLPQPSEDVLNTNTGFEDFLSRREAYGKLWNQLESEDCQILGIYGMPGAGKTLMTEQLRKDAQGQKKKIFDKVILAVVGSVAVDVIKLQDQLARDLKCDLEWKDDIKNRAHQLKNSMMNSGKILVIFDDVWGEISICDIIGTSFNVPSSKTDHGRLDGDHSWKGCKILFTSREKLHCLNNNCKDPVEIKTLEDDEAWRLFKNTLGTDQDKSPPDESLVRQVCKKCAGLPLIIHAVGKALKFKSAFLWKDALLQLENCKFENVVGIDPKVYACLKLSFDNLLADAKQCLLLCSLFPADMVILNNMLLFFAAGSQLLHGGRTRVYGLIEILRSASLLLEGNNAESFRLHDIIRDVARSVAVKEHAFFIEACGRGLSGNSADYSTGKVMQLELKEDDFSFPDDMVCPDLHTFRLMGTYRKNEQKCEVNITKFPSGMFLNLRVLELQDLIWEQQLDLRPLNKLKSLMVSGCKIVDTDVACFPESLETLLVGDCDLPARLDFAKLKNLRTLEVFGTNDLQMVPNTISGLSYLEELHLGVAKWVDRKRALVPKFNEISKLTRLTNLSIYWSDFEPSQDTSIFGQLVKYDICVHVIDGVRMTSPSPGVETRKVELAGRLQFERFQSLLERAELIILKNSDVNLSRIWNSNIEAFQDLERLYIDVSDTMEYLARLEIESIQRSSFSNLTILCIKGCSSMKYLFNNFVAEYLVQLEELNILSCDRMEVIVKNEGKSDADLINFSKLKVMRLVGLSNLKSFYGETKDMHSSSTSMMDNSVIPSVQPQPLFDGMVAFPSLEVLGIAGLEVSEIWGNKYYTNDNESSSFRKLKSLYVSFCSGLKNVFINSSVANDLIMHLEEMNISDCGLMGEITGKGEPEEITEEITDDDDNGVIRFFDGDDDDGIVFPVLTKLKLIRLPNLSSSWIGEANTYKVKFPVLVELAWRDLKIDLEEIELGRVDSPCQLEYLNLSCDREIQLSSAWQLRLCDLKSLTLGGCLSYVLKSFSCFKRLTVLNVTELDCSTLFSLSVLVSLQQLQELNISDCSLLEKIVEDARDDEASGMVKHTIILFHLRVVFLTNLPKLKSFIHNSAECDLHMPALTRVEVVKCGVSTLFTCSFIQKLQQLEVLAVHECNSLEGIVADERGSETSDTNDKMITLSKLSSVDLGDLPNLKSFSLAVSYAYSMPQLRHFELRECPNLEYFTSLKTTTGLVRVYSELHDGEEFPDLNDCIRQNRKIRDSPVHQPLQVPLFSNDSPTHQPLQVAFFSYAWSCPWAC